MANIPAPPTYADPVLVDKLTKKAGFNPIWLNWFLSVAQILKEDSLGGDVVGPASAIADNIVLFNGTSGKLIKDSGKAVPAGTIAGSNNHLGFFAATTSAQLAGVISDETGSGALVFANTPTLVTPNIGAATGTSLAATGALSSSGTAGIGYATGAGGTVTQITSKATGVTLDKITGEITMDAANLGADTTVSFTLTNSTIAATDVLILNHASAGTAGSYLLNAQAAAGSASINVRNITAGALAEAIVIRFAVIKAVNS